MTMGRVRSAVLAALIGPSLLMAATPAAQAAFGPEVFEAGTCFTKTCTYGSVEANPKEAFTQAAGHPPWGGTKFIMKHNASNVEGASVKRIRVDVPPGLAANPQAPTPKCSVKQFQTSPKGCPPASEVGTTEMEAVAEPQGLLPLSLPSLEGKVYNLEAPAGLPLDFGIAVEPGGELLTPIHLFLEGHVDWSGDYHEYFEINNVPKEAEVKVLLGVKSPLKVLMSKLNFNGHAGGDFLTLPSVCSSTTTSHLELESWSGEIARTDTHTPVGVEGCDKVPFEPTVTLTPENTGSDQPDGGTVEVKAPQNAGENEIDTSDIKDVHATLPEGVTLNPSAAHGLQACTEEQAGLKEAAPGIRSSGPVTCPAGSKVGTVTIETDLPPGSLAGDVFLGSPHGGPITGPPYTIYIDAESELGVSVRLQGSVTPNPSTGRLEATFADNPQLPFSDLVMKFKGGPQAPVANPLVCGTTFLETLFTPYTGQAPFVSSTPFATTGCPSPLPFSLGQGTTSSSSEAGAHTSYTFNLARSDGQQYLSQLTTTLPPGLIGAIPSVALCGEPRAQAGTCAASSEIGQATVQVGAGSEPYSFAGPVYLTGPYDGAPYGLSIAVPAAAGPFDLGSGACDCVVTRVALGIDPHTARVIATSALPTIVKGVPLRLKSLSVAVTRPSFLFNPTDCDPLSTDSTLTSTFGARQNVTSPFQVSDCAALGFTPSFEVSTGAKTSKANGASLRVNLTQAAHQANIKSVFAQLPAQLPARLSTLRQACTEATFAHDPRTCPSGSLVGGATVTTPVLPDKLSGPVYLVSHGGAAFPDLDLILEGDGVQVIVTGNTNIKQGITSSTFAAIPDVPVSNFVLNLPIGPHSVLAANGDLCTGNLAMPTTIVAQNGKQLKQNTHISVSGCGVRILKHKVRGSVAYLTVETFAPGRVSVGGPRLRRVSRRLAQARRKLVLKVPLSRAGHSHRKPLRARVRVGFVPSNRGEPSSVAFATVTFR